MDSITMRVSPDSTLSPGLARSCHPVPVISDLISMRATTALLEEKPIEGQHGPRRGPRCGPPCRIRHVTNLPALADSQLKVEGRVAVLSFNRDDVRNAL